MLKMLKDVDKKLLSKFIAIDLQFVNHSAGIRLKSSMHRLKKSFIAIFRVIVS